MMASASSGPQAASDRAGVEGVTVEADRVLDAGESGCGELVLLVFEQMKTLAPDQVLLVLAHDVAAEVDLPAWCRTTSNPLLAHQTHSLPKRFWIRKRV